MRNSTRTTQALDDIRTHTNRIATATEALASPPAIHQETHFHDDLLDRRRPRPGASGHVVTGEGFRREAEREVARAEVAKLFEPEVTNPDARVAVLAVSLNLKNRLDAKSVIEGAQVLEVIDAYKRVQALRDLLGAVTDDELAEATALYDELAS